MYADVETLLVAWLAAAFPNARVCAELPARLPEITIQVERLAGGDEGRSLDVATVDIDIYAPDRITANRVAAQVRHSLRFDAIGYQHLGAVISNVQTASAPGWRPYENTNCRRVGMALTVVLHNLT